MWSSSWFRYKTIFNLKKLTTGQGENYTTGYLLDYGYIKNHYGLLIVCSSRQKELYADPKVVQQIEFVEQFKKLDNANNNAESLFLSTILEKNK